MSDPSVPTADPGQPKQSATSDVVSVTDVIELVRRHRGMFATLAVAIVVAVTTIGYLSTSSNEYYETEALVIATELEIRIESLPRTAVAIFNAGTVAARTVELAGTGLDPDDLIPGIVNVQPLENTSVIEIDARHPDPELAALYANAAGEALVEEMNQVGPGLGTFTLQIPAPVPTEPTQQSMLPIVVISVMAATALVLGVAALIAMFSSTEVEPAPERSTAASVDRPDATPKATTPAPQPQPQPQPKPKPKPKPVVTAEPSGNEHPHPDGKRPEQKAEIGSKKPGEDDLNELEMDEIEPLVHHLDTIPRPAPIHPLASSAEQAYALMESISGVGPVFGARLAALGITKVSELAAADPKWVADAVEVRREVVVDWIRQAIGLHSELHDDREDAGEAEDA